MGTGKKRNNRKKTVAYRTSSCSLAISKKNNCISHSEVRIKEQWDTVYISARELRTSKTEILQNMELLRKIFGTL